MEKRKRKEEEKNGNKVVTFDATCEYVEVYNEQAYDLLGRHDLNMSSMFGAEAPRRREVKVRTPSSRNVHAMVIIMMMMMSMLKMMIRTKQKCFKCREKLATIASI